MGKIEIKKTTSVDLFPGSSKKAKFLAGKKFIIGDPHISYQLYKDCESILNNNLFQCCLVRSSVTDKGFEWFVYILTHKCSAEK